MTQNQHPKRYTVTAALPYTNGPVHIGHLAGVYIPADIYVRYLRAKKQDVIYICGSDEHGVPITIRAQKEGVTPQQIVDKYHAIIKQSFADFGISFDNYSRTSAPIHHQTASDFFKKMYDAGQFIEESAFQLYDEKAGQFLADRFVIGTCPKCGNESSYGDQCEKCGTSHNATDLINPKSAITGNTPSLKETKHWYLPLDQYQDWLKEWILEGHKNDWKSNVLGQVKSWLDDGLKPRAVTRDLDWGIPVPVAGADGKVLYVWFDAPIGYISSTKEWAAREGKDWKPYWQSPDTKLLHFIGKDNIVFHCIIFPAMLKAEGSFIVPENVPANEFLNLESNKISTSKNWAVWLHEYLLDFPGKQDVLRYVLTANAPETKDNDFTWKDFQARNNNELVAILGNFVNRVMVLTHKYYHGVVPVSSRYFTELDQIQTFATQIGTSIEHYKFREALQELMNLARLGNGFLQENEPWKKVGEQPEEVQNIMFAAIQITAALAHLAEPFLPFMSAKLKKMLLISDTPWDEVTVLEGHYLIAAGHQLGASELLFDKIEDEAIQKQLDKLEATKMQNVLDQKVVEPQKELITYEQFVAMDIRIGTIVEAEKVAKANKLLKLTVAVGIDTRTIVSGIAEHFTPEEIIGQQVQVLVNLAPRNLRGIDSHGMILMTESKDGKLKFVAPQGEDIPDGATVR
ncbi:MAG: methionine--tRNA ligase [Flavobacteriaceae bacterium]|nr:methionine--tRNA ligase [Flavobacteriaceae bacterium]